MLRATATSMDGSMLVSGIIHDQFAVRRYCHDDPHPELRLRNRKSMTSYLRLIYGLVHSSILLDLASLHHNITVGLETDLAALNRNIPVLLHCNFRRSCFDIDLVIRIDLDFLGLQHVFLR